MLDFIKRLFTKKEVKTGIKNHTKARRKYLDDLVRNTDFGGVKYRNLKK